MFTYPFTLYDAQAPPPTQGPLVDVPNGPLDVDANTTYTQTSDARRWKTSATSEGGTWKAWRAFDDTISGDLLGWQSQDTGGGAGADGRYDASGFPEPGYAPGEYLFLERVDGTSDNKFDLSSVKFWIDDAYHAEGMQVLQFILSGSDDGISWTDEVTQASDITWSDNTTTYPAKHESQVVNFTTTNAYRRFRLLVTKIGVEVQNFSFFRHPSIVECQYTGHFWD